MAEAFAIIGLASSLLTFVDFGIKIISAVKAAHESAHGTLPEVNEIELVLADVRVSNLKATQGSLARQISPGEQHIMDMAMEWTRLEGELTEIVKKLKIRNDATFKRIEPGRVAFRALRKGKDIDDLRRRIENLDVRAYRRFWISLNVRSLH